jgi:trimeric autotransporter adhesin
MNPLIQLKKPSPLFLISLSLMLACFALSPRAHAVIPPPDGGYPGSNTAEGDDALFSLTSGESNTAVGFIALFSNTTGNHNTATGSNALRENRTGLSNTAIGSGALLDNTTGDGNTATGSNALFSNTTGGGNTANGLIALFSNTGGSNNTASGVQALFSNTTGDDNTASGVFALRNNTTGRGNTANGVEALSNNTDGFQNTATGEAALFSNTNAFSNTANGVVALYNNTTGNDNTATGVRALFNNTTGSNNIALGVNAGDNLTIGDNNIDIGNRGVGPESGTIRIGTQGTQVATFIAGISGTPIGGGGGTVRVNASGQLGTAPSSARFKEKIKPMDKASETILALKPVTFRYKHELDPESTPQFGLVAEEVEKVDPDLVAHDAKGKVYTVRYEAVNAMLLNEFLKEHRKVEEQEATIIQLKSSVSKQGARIANQQKQIEALTAGLQKVSAQVEMSRPAPQTVLNNQ